MRSIKGFSVLVVSLMLMMSTLVGCGGGGGGGSQSAAAGPGSASSPGSTSSADAGSVSAAKVVNLQWDPSTNADGTPAANLAGYKVHYGTASGTYSAVVTVNQGNTTAVTLDAPGTYYFVVSAIDTDGNESGYSEEVSAVVS